MSINFTVGKIPGEVVELSYEGESLSISEAIRLGSAECGFSYTETDVVHLNGDVASRDAVVNDGDVVLVDTPKIKGAQMVVSVKKEGGLVKTVALHLGDTVRAAVSVLNISLSHNETVYVNDSVAGLDTIVNEGDVISIKCIRPLIGASPSNRNIDIYAAISRLQEDVRYLTAKIS